MVTTNPNKLVILNQTSTTPIYQVQSSIDLSTTPKFIYSIEDSNYQVIGFTDGTLSVVNLKSDGSPNIVQTVNTGFSTLGAGYGRFSRFAVCDGGATGKVRVYYWNYTTSRLNGDLAADTLSTGETVPCTALAFTGDEAFIAVGYQNGHIREFERKTSSNNTYTLSSAVVSTDGVATTALRYNSFGNILVSCTAESSVFINWKGTGTWTNQLDEAKP